HYGSIPRLLIAWMATEAVMTQRRELELGGSLSAFMRELGLMPTGGRWGTIPRLKEQSRRLFSSFIQCSYSSDNSNVPIESLQDNNLFSATSVSTNGLIHEAIQNMTVVDAANLWWTPNANQQSLFTSTVTLSESFFDEIIKNPVPVDMRALQALKQSPMALDIYCWITYRMSYLYKTTTIPWESLQAQFGAGYPLTSKGKANFKSKFLQHLKKVQIVYPSACVNDSKNGLMIKPSKTHIPMMKY
ncbi:MAG: replication protein RepA, partial [Anaerolineales bacterium]|nr:replication protein RepA [Anaerolineales bacterium]